MAGFRTALAWGGASHRFGTVQQELKEAQRLADLAEDFESVSEQRHRQERILERILDEERGHTKQKSGYSLPDDVCSHGEP